MPDDKTAAERLATLAMTDPIARAARGMHESGEVSLVDALIEAAEAWSRRCREVDSERLDALLRQPVSWRMVTPEADVERIEALTRART